MLRDLEKSRISSREHPSPGENTLITVLWMSVSLFPSCPSAYLLDLGTKSRYTWKQGGCPCVAYSLPRMLWPQMLLSAQPCQSEVMVAFLGETTQPLKVITLGTYIMERAGICPHRGHTHIRSMNLPSLDTVFLEAVIIMMLKLEKWLK